MGSIPSTIPGVTVTKTDPVVKIDKGNGSSIAIVIITAVVAISAALLIFTVPVHIYEIIRTFELFGLIIVAVIFAHKIYDIKMYWNVSYYYVIVDWDVVDFRTFNDRYVILNILIGDCGHPAQYKIVERSLVNIHI